MAQLRVTDVTAPQFRVRYNATNYVDFNVSSGGDLTIVPTGGDVAVTGNLSISGSVTGTVSFGGDVVASLIRRATADGADNSVLSLTGGGAHSATRGAYISLHGNEHAETGEVRIVGGGVAGGEITFYTGATSTLRGTVTDGGVFAWGTTVTAGASAGAMVLPNNIGIRGVTPAGTGSTVIGKIDASGYPQLGNGSVHTKIGYLSNASLAGGGSSANGAAVIDSTNNRFVFYSGGNRYYVTGTSF